jgi:hypothetical protein
MSTSVSVNTYTHTATHVANKMLHSFQQIVRLIGLDPGKLSDDWPVLERGIAAWLNSKHLWRVVLEVWNSATDQAVTRWDMNIDYGYSGDGSLWADTDTIRYHIAKAGLVPSRCDYRIIVNNHDGYPAVEGWNTASLRSTEHLKRFSVGSTIGGNGIATPTSYWR